MEQEAAALRARFDGVNRAAFARQHNLKGGQALIYQHINALRPISLDAAKVYAKGFGVGLEEISPRLALEVRNAAPYASGGPLLASEPTGQSRSGHIEGWPFTASRDDFEKLRPEDKAALDKTLTAFIAGSLASYETQENAGNTASNQRTEKNERSATMDAVDEAVEAMERVAQGSEGHGRARRANSGRGKSS